MEYRKFPHLLHRKLAIMVVSGGLRLFQKKLRAIHKDMWNYELPLAQGDSLQFFPYIVSIGRRYIKPKGGDLRNGLLWGRGENAIKDPINIVAYGIGQYALIELLKKSTPRWQQFFGVIYFLHASGEWHANTSTKIVINEKTGERHHIRLFELISKQGTVVTVCASHTDTPYDERGEHGDPKSWDISRDLVARGLAALQPELTEQITQENFRGVKGDGRILVINALNHE